MKYYNQKKIHKRLIYLIEVCVLFLGAIFRLTKSLICLLRPCGERYVLVVDGFLVGDSVLLRPFVKELIKKYSDTHRILILSGKHSFKTYEDILSDIEILNLQFPWATYDYSFRKLLELLWVLGNLLRKDIDVAIESRGDFRSIAWTYLACPNKLFGFDFTGGAKLLTDVVPDDGSILHLFEHVRNLGTILGCNVNSDDVVIQNSNSCEVNRIGISFSGSQKLRNLPEHIGYQIIERMIKTYDAEIWYIRSPSEKIYSDYNLRTRFGNRLKIFSGDFCEYTKFLQSLCIYIGMDSGGGHLCSMWGIPSVIIFGTQVSSYSKPIGVHPLLCVETKKSINCRPCDATICTNSTFQQCLADIDTDSIFQFSDQFVPHAS